MAGRATLIGTLIVFATLAGCSGGSDNADAVETDGTAVGPDGDSQFAGTGSIKGLVVDEDSLPIGGAQVAIIAAGLEASTGEAGAFTFKNLAAGSHQVFVQKLGYETQAKAVQVVDGQETQVQFILAEIRVDAVFNRVIGPYAGHVACGYSQPGVSGVRGSTTGPCPYQGTIWEPAFGDNENLLEFQLEQENVWAVMGEMRWTPSAYATSERFALFFTYEDGYGPNWWCQGAGNSPVYFLYHVDEEKKDCARSGSGDRVEDPPDMDQTLHLTAFVDFHIIDPDNVETVAPNVALGQKYESIVTIYYGQDPVLPYTAFTDA